MIQKFKVLSFFWTKIFVRIEIERDGDIKILSKWRGFVQKSSEWALKLLNEKKKFPSSFPRRQILASLS